MPITSSPLLGGVVNATLQLAVALEAAISAGTVLGSNAAEDLLYDVSTSDPLPQQQTVGTPLASALGNATQSLVDSLVVNATVLSLPLGVSIDSIKSDLTTTIFVPVLTALDEAVLDPIMRGLGVNLGGADIEFFNLETDESRLVR